MSVRPSRSGVVGPVTVWISVIASSGAGLAPPASMVEARDADREANGPRSRDRGPFAARYGAVWKNDDDKRLVAALLDREHLPLVQGVRGAGSPGGTARLVAVGGIITSSVIFGSAARPLSGSTMITW